MALETSTENKYLRIIGVLITVLMSILVFLYNDIRSGMTDLRRGQDASVMEIKRVQEAFMVSQNADREKLSSLDARQNGQEKTRELLWNSLLDRLKVMDIRIEKIDDEHRQTKRRKEDGR